LCIAWTLRNKDVNTVICGFSKTSQVLENIKALEMVKKFTKEIDLKLEKILGNTPVRDEFHPKTAKAYAPRR